MIVGRERELRALEIQHSKPRSGFSDSFQDYMDEHPGLNVDLVDIDRLREWAERDTSPARII